MRAGAVYDRRFIEHVATSVGTFAATGTVSHVVMDHSSIVKFLEYNFLPPALWVGEADARVNNIGSLLDPTKTGIVIP